MTDPGIRGVLWISGCVFATEYRDLEGVVVRRACQMVSLFILALALFVVQSALGMKYYTAMGPGPGFIPLWIGAVLAVLSVVWFIQVSRGPALPTPEGFVPDRGGVLRVVAVLASLALFPAIAEQVGFRVTMLGFLLFLFAVLGRQKLLVTLALSLIGSFGQYFLFHDLLGLHLPKATVDILQNLGL